MAFSCEAYARTGVIVYEALSTLDGISGVNEYCDFCNDDYCHLSQAESFVYSLKTVGVNNVNIGRIRNAVEKALAGAYGMSLLEFKKRYLVKIINQELFIMRNNKYALK